MPIEHNPQDIADLITASLEAMQMNSNYATVKVEPIAPSELELRIRKEVLENIETLLNGLHNDSLTDEYQIDLLSYIKTYLNLMWGEKK
jgi:hypothetical protein